MRLGFAFAVDDCVFSPDGTEIFAAGAEGIGRIFDVNDGSLIGRLVGHSHQITGVDWMTTQDGDFLLTASEDLTVKQWQRSDVIKGDVFESLAEGSFKPGSAFAADYAPNGDLYGISAGSHLWKCNNLRNTSELPFLQKYADGPSVNEKGCGVLSPDGSKWAICSYTHSSEIISAETGQLLRTFPLEVAHTTLCWDPTGASRFIASGHGKEAVVWNADSGEKECIFDINTWVFDASWSSNGRYVAIAQEKHTEVPLLSCLSIQYGCSD